MELPLQHGMMDSKSGRQMLSDDDDDMAFAEAQFEPDPEDKAFLAREIAKDIAVAKAGEDLPHAMFDPRENFMITWASMVAVCIIYNVIYGPIQVAFRVPAHDVLGKVRETRSRGPTPVACRVARRTCAATPHNRRAHDPCPSPLVLRDSS